ncbi:MAG: hypothetical protein M0R51_00930, partial [Clostridia bacterium]|nr:hypothetical protein [Clostridia bacterium]
MNTKEKLYLNAKEKYYQGEPILTDAEFDRLELELKNEGSNVIEIVGFDDRNLKFPHISPMLSLSKYQTDKLTGQPPIANAIDWMKQHIVGKQEHFEWTPKLDGNAGNIIYKKGKLHLALSRGNGTKGRDITDKLFDQLPKTIPCLSTVEIRGEIVMPRAIFNKKYAAEFANERNLVAGILAKDVTPATKSRLKDIVFMAVEIKKHDDGIVEYMNIDCLTDWGFNKQYPLEKYWVHYSDFEKSFYKMKDYRENRAPFLLDGFVIKVAEKYREQFGENSHDPNWAIAIKFAPKDVSTPNETLQWNFGKTGEMIPVGIFEPVDLDGTIVKRASLYNYGFVIKNKVFPGAICTIVKAGDIIPQVVAVTAPGDESKFNAPTHCPHCKSKLVIEDVHLMCKNSDCSGIKKAMFSQGVAMLDLFGVGGSMIEDIFNSGFTEAIDLLNPTKFNKQTLISKGIVTDGKIVDNLFSEIENTKELPLQKLILMLGYQGMGTTTSKQVANLVAGVDYNFSGLQKTIVEGFEKGQPKRIKLDNAIGELMQFIDIKMP